VLTASLNKQTINDLHSFTPHTIFENIIEPGAPDFKKYLHLPSETQISLTCFKPVLHSITLRQGTNWDPTFRELTL